MEQNILMTIAIWAIPTLFAITAHEAAHGWMAKLMGDNTAYRMGRVTLNPAPHIDPIGTILFPAIGVLIGGFMFGWAKPVPIDPSKMRYPRKSPFWVALAGPLSNFLMAFIWVVVAIVGTKGLLGNNMLSTYLGLVGMAGIQINMVMMILNLFPLPPLDGGRMVDRFLTGKAKVFWGKIEQYGLIIIIVLALTKVLETIWFKPMFQVFGWIPAMAS